MGTAESDEATQRSSTALGGTEPDYRQKLKRARAVAVSDAATSSSSSAECVRNMAERRDMESTSVQSVLVAALQVLHRVRQREKQVADACLSKGQDEKFHGMIATLDNLDRALRNMLSEQGAKMLDLTMASPERAEGEKSWRYTLTKALRTIEEDIEWIIALVARQPRGSTGRTLTGAIVRLLHRHHNVLRVEVEQWTE